MAIAVLETGKTDPTEVSDGWTAVLILGEVAGSDLEIQWQKRLDYQFGASVIPTPDLNRDGYIDIAFEVFSGGTGQFIDWYAVSIQPDSASLLGERSVPSGRLASSPLGVIERSTLGDFLIVWEDGRLQETPIEIPYPENSVVVRYKVTDQGVEFDADGQTVLGQNQATTTHPPRFSHNNSGDPNIHETPPHRANMTIVSQT